MIVLRQKIYAGIYAIGDNLVSGANIGNRSQSYYDDLAKEWGSKTNKELINNNKGLKVSSDVGTRNLGGNTIYKKTTPKMNLQEVAQSSYRRGQASVSGLKQGALNIWRNMKPVGKAGTIVAGLGATYLMGKGLFGGKKDKN